MTDTKRLDCIIKDSGYKYTHIARTLGICYQALRNKLDNKSEFLPSEIETLCGILNIETYADREAIFFAKNVESFSTKVKGMTK